jgi:type II secretory pathway pseudopilin PulG
MPCPLLALIGGACAFVVVIAMLAAIAVPSFMTARERAQATASLVKAQQIVVARPMFAADAPDGRFPAALDELVPRYLPSTDALIDPLAASSSQPPTRSGMYAEVRRDGSGEVVRPRRDPDE